MISFSKDGASICVNFICFSIQAYSFVLCKSTVIFQFKLSWSPKILFLQVHCEPILHKPSQNESWFTLAYLLFWWDLPKSNIWWLVPWEINFHMYWCQFVQFVCLIVMNADWNIRYLIVGLKHFLPGHKTCFQVECVWDHNQNCISLDGWFIVLVAKMFNLNRSSVV